MVVVVVVVVVVVAGRGGGGGGGGVVVGAGPSVSSFCVVSAPRKRLYWCGHSV